MAGDNTREPSDQALQAEAGEEFIQQNDDLESSRDGDSHNSLREVRF